MKEPTYEFDLPLNPHSIIKVMGVGGGGSNAVNYMYGQDPRDVSFIVCNTDKQALESCLVPTKLAIGEALTSGLGAGGDPDKGKDAALESRELIEEKLSGDTKMLFITAGLGGGTGTGAAPEIARMAKEMGILTVGIVTLPFGFEGPKKEARALHGLEKMKDACDTVLVILNDKLLHIYKDLDIHAAFSKVDDILNKVARCISNIVVVPGKINVDFEDVKTVLKDAGDAVIGTGVAEGKHRAQQAIETAMSSPLLNDKDVAGASKILLLMSASEQSPLTVQEIQIITDHIRSCMGQDGDLKFGHSTDSALKESLHVTLVAAGFPKKPLDNDDTQVYSLGNGPLPDSPSFTDGVGNTPPFDEPQNVPSADSNAYVDVDQSSMGSSSVRASSSVHDPELEVLTGEADAYVAEEAGLQEAIPHIQPIQRQEPLPSYHPSREKDFTTPAFIRKKVPLSQVRSAESNQSEYVVNKNSQLVGGQNRFLHRNVD